MYYTDKGKDKRWDIRRCSCHSCQLLSELVRNRCTAQMKPYCTGKSMQLSLVPWSCVLDDDTALLSCTPAYLTFSKYAGEAA